MVISMLRESWSIAYIIIDVCMVVSILMMMMVAAGRKLSSLRVHTPYKTCDNQIIDHCCLRVLDFQLFLLLSHYLGIHLGARIKMEIQMGKRA